MNVADTPNMQVVKSNKLIESSYKLGKREQYFVLYLISELDSIKQTDFEGFEMTYNEIIKILNYDGIKRIANRDVVFEIMNNLNMSPIKWNTLDENGELEEKGQVTWISAMKYNVKNDTFTFHFPRELKPYLLQLEKYFTKYALKNIRYFNINHSTRMYEIFKRYENKTRPFTKVILTIDKIKFYLGLEDKYHKFYEFKRWVLEPTKKELNTLTDIHIDYKVAKKEKRKVVSLEFIISSNKKRAKELLAESSSSIIPTLNEDAPSFDKIYTVVKEWGIAKKKLQEYIVDYSLEYVEKRVRYVQNQLFQKAKKGQIIKNMGGYLNKMMAEQNLVDYVQIKKEIAVKKKTKQAAQVSIQNNLKAELKALNKEKFTKQFAMAQQLFESQKGLKETIIKAVKNKRINGYNDNKTEAENLATSGLFRSCILQAVQSLFSSRFEEIENEYIPRINKLEKALGVKLTVKK